MKFWMIASLVACLSPAAFADSREEQINHLCSIHTHYESWVGSRYNGEAGRKTCVAQGLKHYDEGMMSLFAVTCAQQIDDDLGALTRLYLRFYDGCTMDLKKMDMPGKDAFLAAETACQNRVRSLDDEISSDILAPGGRVFLRQIVLRNCLLESVPKR